MKETCLIKGMGVIERSEMADLFSRFIQWWNQPVCNVVWPTRNKPPIGAFMPENLDGVGSSSKKAAMLEVKLRTARKSMWEREFWR